MIRAVRSIISLKWALLVGGARGSTQTRIQLVVSFLLAILFGLAAVTLFVGLGRTADLSDDALVLVLTSSTLGVALFAATTGVEASLDPRRLAAEPLSATRLTAGMLASTVIGPPAVLAALSGIGLFLGWRGGNPSRDVVLVVVIVLWWTTLVLASRTVANVIGAWATGRFRRLAQLGAVLASLLGWAVANLLMGSRERWNSGTLRSIARLAEFTPPGRLAMAVTTGGSESIVSLLIGVSWLPVLVWASVVTTGRMIVVPPALVDSAAMRSGDSGLYGMFTRLLDPRPDRDRSRRIRAITRRTMVTKIRTPRQSVNTLMALVVGGGALILGPLLDGGVQDPRSVLLGGMLQFAVLFDGNNAFGVDGPAIWAEVTAGVDARDLVRGKVLASVLTIGPFALAVPLVLAAMADAWQWLPAAWMLAVGAVTSAAGVAVVMASLTPVAMPLSANPLAAGDTGQGCLAGVMLGAGVVALAVVTAPFVIAIYLVSSHSIIIATLISVLVPPVGLVTARGGIALAERRLTGREPLLVDLVTPRL